MSREPQVDVCSGWEGRKVGRHHHDCGATRPRISGHEPPRRSRHLVPLFLLGSVHPWLPDVVTADGKERPSDSSRSPLVKQAWRAATPLLTLRLPWRPCCAILRGHGFCKEQVTVVRPQEPFGLHHTGHQQPRPEHRCRSTQAGGCHCVQRG